MNLRHIGNGLRLIGAGVMVWLLVPLVVAFFQRKLQPRPLHYVPDDLHEASQAFGCGVRAYLGVAVGFVLMWLGDVLKSRSRERTK